MIWLGRPGISGPGILSVGVGVAGGRGWRPTFLLRDEFLTDEAAPMASPRTAEPGPGTGTIVDTESKMSVSGAGLQVAGGKAVPSYGDPGIWYGAETRAVGKAVFHKVNITTLAFAGIFGWDNTQANRAEAHSLWPRASSVLSFLNGTTITTVGSSVSTGVDYLYAIILRANGAFGLVKGGEYLDWTLVWVSDTGSQATVYPAMTNWDLVFAQDFMRVTDLPAPWDTDFGVAVTNLAGARSVNDTLTHEADGLLYLGSVTVPSAGVVRQAFRWVDDDNCWIFEVTSAGNVNLIERVAGVETNRGSAAGVFTTGHRAGLIFDGNTIRGYSNNVLRWTYSSAANFNTATTAKVLDFGTGGGITGANTWPRQISGTAASRLNAVTE